MCRSARSFSKISLQATPGFSSGQALAYTITVANTGGATASGLTLTDSLVGLGIGSFPSSPWMTTSTGSCSYASPTVTCSAAKAVLIVTLCGVPAVATTLAGTPGWLVSAKLAGVAIPVTLAVTV